jgi:hypothetical protein
MGCSYLGEFTTKQKILCNYLLQDLLLTTTRVDIVIGKRKIIFFNRASTLVIRLKSGLYDVRISM